MPRGLIVSCLLIVNMKLLVKIGNFLKCKSIYIVTLCVAHWGALR